MVMRAALVLALASAARGGALPSVWPVSTTYFSTDPAASAQFMASRLNASVVAPNISSACGAELAWVRMPGSGYEFHFVREGDGARSGGALDPAGYVAYVDALYGNLSAQSASAGCVRRPRARILARV